MDSLRLGVSWVPLTALFCSPANPRHNDEAVPHVAASLRRFGWQQPVVAKPSGEVIAGNTRLKAAASLGMTEVPVVRFEGSDLDAAAFAIADNRTHEFATWHDEALAGLLQQLRAEDALQGVGYSGADIDALLDELQAASGSPTDGDEDSIPEPPDAAATRTGDLWLLGNHRLLCGDSASPADVDRLVAGQPVHLVNTDPPYNVKVEPRSNNAIAAGLSSFGPSHHQKLDVARHPSKARRTTQKMRPKDRPLANDFVTDAAFDTLLEAWFGNIARVLLPGRSFYIWGGYANCGNYPPVLKRHGLYFSQSIIWDKQHPVLTRKDFMGAHEWCFYGWREGAAHQYFGPNNATDLWAIKKVNPQSMSHLCLHPEAAVMTEAGFRPIRSIQVGDRVLAGDGTFHRVEHVSSHAYTSEHLYRITAKGGSATTEASDNHPFLIWRPSKRGARIVDGEVAWVRADALRVGDYTMTPILADSGSDPFPKLDEEDPPLRRKHDGREYSLRYVKHIEPVRYTGDVWNLSVEGCPSFQTSVGLSHNTEKPVELATRALLYSSRRGERVLDLFGGSGSTLIACEETERCALLMELDPPYCDVIVTRWQTRTGKQATLESTGQSFEAVAAERLGAEATDPAPA